MKCLHTARRQFSLTVENVLLHRAITQRQIALHSAATPTLWKRLDVHMMLLGPLIALRVLHLLVTVIFFQFFFYIKLRQVFGWDYCGFVLSQTGCKFKTHTSIRERLSCCLCAGLACVPVSVADQNDCT